MKNNLYVITDFSHRKGGDNVVCKILQDDCPLELYNKLLQRNEKLIIEIESP